MARVVAETAGRRGIPAPCRGYLRRQFGVVEMVWDGRGRGWNALVRGQGEHAGRPQRGQRGREWERLDRRELASRPDLVAGPRHRRRVTCECSGVREEKMRQVPPPALQGCTTGRHIRGTIKLTATKTLGGGGRAGGVYFSCRAITNIAMFPHRREMEMRPEVGLDCQPGRLGAARQATRQCGSGRAGVLQFFGNFICLYGTETPLFFFDIHFFLIDD